MHVRCGITGLFQVRGTSQGARGCRYEPNNSRVAQNCQAAALSLGTAAIIIFVSFVEQYMDRS